MLGSCGRRSWILWVPRREVRREQPQQQQQAAAPTSTVPTGLGTWARHSHFWVVWVISTQQGWNESTETLFYVSLWWCRSGVFRPLSWDVLHRFRAATQIVGSGGVAVHIQREQNRTSSKRRNDQTNSLRSYRSWDMQAYPNQRNRLFWGGWNQ